MPLPVNTRVSLSLHPSNVTALDGYDDDTAPLLAGTVSAFTSAYQGVGEMWAAKDIVDQNDAWTPAKRIIEMDKLRDRKFATMAKAFDTATDYVDRNIKLFEAELSMPVVSKAATTVSVEIRNHVKDLPSGERNDFIQRALKDGDEVTLSAVLGAPAYLSGLTGEAQKIYLRMMHERMQPEKAKKLKALKAASELIRLRSGLIFGELEKAVGASSEKVAELRKRHEAATKALA